MGSSCFFSSGGGQIMYKSKRRRRLGMVKRWLGFFSVSVSDRGGKKGVSCKGLIFRNETFTGTLVGGLFEENRGAPCVTMGDARKPND